MLLHLLRMLSSLAHYLANLNYRQPSWLARSREGIRTRDACPRHVGPLHPLRSAPGARASKTRSYRQGRGGPFWQVAKPLGSDWLAQTVKEVISACAAGLLRFRSVASPHFPKRPASHPSHTTSLSLRPASLISRPASLHSRPASRFPGPTVLTATARRRHLHIA